jgi:hypothetical protein
LKKKFKKEMNDKDSLIHRMIDKKNPKHTVQWYEDKYKIKILNYKPKKDDSSSGSSDNESGEDEILEAPMSKSKSCSVVHGSN